MRLKSFHWYDFALGAAPLLFPIWQVALDWADKKHRAGPQSNEQKEVFIRAVLAFQYVVPVLFALFLGGTYLYKHSKEAAPRRTVHNFLNLLHGKFFPHASGGLRPDYRISLFTPTNWAKPGVKLFRYPTTHKHLSLYTRSGDMYPRSKVSWDGTKSEAGRYDGIVGYAWATRILVDIPNLPDYNNGSDEDRKKYLGETYLTSEKAPRLNVLSRSFRALVVENKSGEKVGVLMVESTSPDGLAAISSDEWHEVAETLQCLFTA